MKITVMANGRTVFEAEGHILTQQLLLPLSDHTPFLFLKHGTEVTIICEDNNGVTIQESYTVRDDDENLEGC